MTSKSNNQIRKFLCGIALAGMILSLCFGMSGSPTVSAQEAWTEIPTIIQTPLESMLLPEIEQAIRDAIEKDGNLLSWPGTFLQLNRESVIISADWGIAYLDYLNNNDASSTGEQPSLILLHHVNGVWSAILNLYKNTIQYNNWLNSLPDDLTLKIVGKDLYLPSLISSLSYDIKTPWKNTSAVVVGGVQDGYARDFIVGGSGMGDEIVAVAGGTVVKVKQDSNDITDNCWIDDITCHAKANMIVINHGGYFSWYVHLKQWSVPVAVSEGKWVNAGDPIGLEGNTGYSSGPHLHFAVSTCADQGAHMFWYHNCIPTQIYSFTGISGTSENWAAGLKINPNWGNDDSSCSGPSNGTPRDNIVLNNNQITFQWTPLACVGLDLYTFRVSNHPDIDNPPWFIDHGVDKNASSQIENIPTEYNGQILYWAIWPHNNVGYGTRGGPWSFKIDTSTPPTPPPLPTGNWNVQYFRNKELTDQCSTTTFDRTFIFQDWGDGAPASGCSSDNWGARFSRRVTFQGGDYTFAIEADDWGRIYVDGNLFVDKWNGASQHYEGHYVSPGDHDVRIEFADTLGAAKISSWWWGPGFDIPHDTQDTSQWYANYWINSTQWWDAFVSRNEGYGILNYDWGYGNPGWDMPSDNFSSKFRRTVYFDCGTYRFTIENDDGAKFSLDGVLKVDRWNGTTGSYSFDLPITQGNHDLQIDHYENGGVAYIGFNWQKLSGCEPSTPTLNSPPNNSFLSWNTDLFLSWYPSSGATQYYASLQGGPGLDMASGWISTTQWNIGILWPGVYTWSVTARNDSGSSAPSSSRTFTINPPNNQTLTVSKSGTGSGTVTSSPTGINCGSTCSYDFTYNTVVTLTATPTSPSTFGGWSGGGCSGKGTCIVTMSSAQSVTATFNSPGVITNKIFLPFIVKILAPLPVTLSIPIRADNLDGYEDTTGFKLSGDGIHDNWIGGTSSNVMAGWIFTNIEIPKGATITNSYVNFRGFGNGTATPRLSGFAEDNPAPFMANGSNKTSLRPTTSRVVDWPNTFSFAWQWFQTPDLSPIIQEIINRSGWMPGNSVGIRASNPSGTGANWCVVDFAGGPYNGGSGSGHSVTLYITYTMP